MAEAGSTVIGIDLGTTNSVAAAWVDGQVQVIQDDDGSVLVPSVVAFLPNGQASVGPAARARLMIDASNTIFSAKRIIGRPFSARDTQEVLGQLPYAVEAGPNDQPMIRTRAGAFPVVDISALVLRHVKARAEHKLGRRVDACVVTVPANFSDSQREATRQAALRAGLEVLRVINEPTAAACALGLTGTENRKVAVYDLGGGTFDFTVLSVHDGVFEVLGTGGEPYLGGDDFDQAIAARLAADFLRQHRIDLNADPGSHAALLKAAEDIKVALSDQKVARGRVPGIAHGPGGKDLDLEYEVTRDEFEARLEPLIQRTLRLAERVLTEADVLPISIDDVALVGGSTLIPIVQMRVAELFGRTPHRSVNPLEAVARGAAVQAHSLWSMAHAIPGSETEDMTSAALLMDVTSHALGIATLGDNIQVIIPKNTPIPCQGDSVFSTVEDNQKYVKIRICQGEAEKFSEANPLGELLLAGLPPRRRGMTEVAVEFIVDADGILQVSARDTLTGQAAEATLSVRGLGERAT